MQSYACDKQKNVNILEASKHAGQPTDFFQKLR